MEEIPDPSNLPRAGPEIDMRSFETRAPEVPVRPVEMPAPFAGINPSPNLGATLSYLTKWRLDLTGVAHMTPGLQELADLPLGQLLCETQGGAGGGVFLCQEDGDGDGEGDDKKGGTVVDEPVDEPVDGPPDEPLFPDDGGDCYPSVKARVKMTRGKGGKREEINTHDLANGFKEIVVPYGWDANITFLPDHTRIRPDKNGTLTGIWEILEIPASRFRFEGTAKGKASELREWSSKKGPTQFGPNDSERRRIDRKTHKITAIWDPDDGEACTKEHRVEVTFAPQIADPQEINLKEAYDNAKRGGFQADGKTSGTRAITGRQPRYRPDLESVVVPFIIYWEEGPGCCGLGPGATKQVIQFARAVIEGPNGHQGKEWGLDISKAARSGAPKHDPTLTSQPGNDAPEVPLPKGGGGTRPETGGLGQWDAPGMAKSLYDRLAAAKDQSLFRQQFLSLLVCRPSRKDGKHHGAQFYLENARVRQILVVTITWRFPGWTEEGRGAPTILAPKQIARTVDCIPLGPFLKVNGLLEEFNEPPKEGPITRIMPKAKYDALKSGVDHWERDPLGQIKLP